MNSFGVNASSNFNTLTYTGDTVRTAAVLLNITANAPTGTNANAVLLCGVRCWCQRELCFTPTRRG